MSQQMMLGIAIGAAITLVIDHLLANVARRAYRAARNIFSLTPIVVVAVLGIGAFILLR
jgi:hypothetical protein